MKTWRMTRTSAFRAGTIGRALFVSLAVLALVFLSTAQAAKPNQAPSVSITSPANNATFTAGSTIGLAASATDPDGSVAKVEFFRGGSVLIGTATTPPFAIQWTNVAIGSYALTAKATDNQGASKVSSAVGITVTQPANAPPNVAITAPGSGSVFTAPATLSVSANASDTDGTIARVEFFAGTTSLGVATSAPYAVNWTNVPAGAYSLTARATDNAGAVTTSAAIAITVGSANLPPLVVLTAPQPCAVYDAPASIVLSADAVDTDGSIARVEFLQGTTVIGSTTSAPYLSTWTNVQEGTHSLTARATDQRGGASTSTPVTITVRNPNQLPSVTLNSPADGSVFNAPSSISCAATASDPDGTIAKVEFIVDGAIVGTVTSPPFQFSWTSPPPGAHQVVARATDNAGGTAQSSVARVTVNGPPVVQITSPAAGASFVAPATIPITASASATAGSVSRIEFYDGTVLIGTVNTSGTSVTAAIDYSNVSPGLHALSAKAVDSAGLVGTSATRTVVVNATPTVVLTTPVAAAQFGAPATIDLAADASVAFGSISMVEFFAGSTRIGLSTTSPYAFRWSDVPAGSYMLTAKATTSAGLTATSGAVAVTVAAVEFTIDAPVSDAALYESAVVVSGTFNALVPGSITINAVPARIGDRSYAALVPLQLGSNTLSVVAETSLGTVTRTVGVSRQLPTLEVTNLANGQTIRDDTVMLRGRANAPANSAVGVNGVLASLAADGSFFVNELVLAPGSNTISIDLVTPEVAAQAGTVGLAGGRRTTAKSMPSLNLELNRDGIAPFTLTLDKKSGFAPLTVNVQLKNRLAYVYDDLDLDIDGNGTIDYSEPGFPIPILEREFNVTYNTPGMYPLTLTLTRQGRSEIVYQATRMVHVQSVVEAAEALRAIFVGMLKRLAAGDTAGASQWLTATIRPRYAEAFNRLSAVLPIVVEGIGTVTDATMGEDFAELSVVRSVSDGLDHYSILMIRDGDGLWRIDGM